MNNTHRFTEEEMDFLRNTVKRGIILEEKERIDLYEVQINFSSQYINGKHFSYLYDSINNCSRQKQEDIQQNKKKILKAITEADDFAIENYCCSDNDDDDYDTCTLVTYKYTPESEELFLKRIEIDGQNILREERKKAQKIAKENTRIVLFEKHKKRKVGRPKKALA